ncbi:AAA family ATPase [Chitinophaga agrisoli]|uniref:AAA family ATPase n=1 Tax=Chitinophaga agrisoli TaxID=2607653 RepID=A0A5B2VJ59_9BACT|nr:AAA family ATPase [Chitinophaga agrisoli]KAA2238570.1 AAA family ATPase [Chitinophaga agrisoli]
MSNSINYISITNFKSIQHLELSGFKRINLFIGRPNVGKSNIIEALSLFSIPHLRENASRKLSTLVRLENEPELFYNGNAATDAVISTNEGSVKLNYHPKEGLKISVDLFGEVYSFQVDEKLMVKSGLRTKSFESPIKRYTYKSDVPYKKGHAKYLIPPFGPNLLSIIEQYGALRNEVTDLFREYGLDIAFDKSSQTIKVIQSNDKDGIFLIPYSSIADTLQRIIFYKTAVASNNDSVLLFEEPEAHSFPPYMAHLTQEMIHKQDNQYFIATHSPFILNDLLENSRSELAVFIVHYEYHETKVKQLSDQDLHDVLQNGMDLFTNSESFI